MSLSAACREILSQLMEVVVQIKPEDFRKPSAVLSHSSVGQHLRHTLEFFICLEQGYAMGMVNYDNRARDQEMETNKAYALMALERICNFVEQLQEQKPLELQVSYGGAEPVTVSTNALRELIYNIEHAVHHMALMKIGIREVAPYVVLPAEFGVAASTLRYKETSSAHQL